MTLRPSRSCCRTRGRSLPRLRRGRGGLTVGELGAQGYDLRRGDLPLPLLVLRESALAHNIARDARLVRRARRSSLAPHGKTTMAPQLIRRQLDAGAWGMTAATVQQLAVMRAAGARRVILANQVVGRAGDRVARARARRGPGARGLLPRRLARRAWRALDAGLAAGARRCGVLIELGGTRAGCRTRRAGARGRGRGRRRAAARARRRRGVRGHVGADREPATLAAVDAFLDRMRELVEALDAAARSPGSTRSSRAPAAARCSTASPSACASAALSRPGAGRRALRLLPHARRRHLRASRRRCPSCARRSSCGRACSRARSRVWRSPGFGKRDAPYDLGLPVVRAARARRACVVEWRCNDQHAFLRDPAGVLRGRRRRSSAASRTRARRSTSGR